MDGTYYNGEITKRTPTGICPLINMECYKEECTFWGLIYADYNFEEYTYGCKLINKE